MSRTPSSGCSIAAAAGRRTAPRAEVQRILQLFRNRYQGFNVAHFHHLARRDHRVTLSYTFVKLALQEAGLIGKARARGRRRRRRGSLQCEMGRPVSLDEMEKELRAANIAVEAKVKKADGIQHPQMCGASTGMMNVYRIKTPDFEKARALGFVPY